jgi:hypothetical protein
MKPLSKKAITRLGLVACVAGVFGGYYLIREGWRRHTLAAFNEQIAEFTKPPRKAASKVPAGMRGKLLPIDVEENRVSPLYFELPDQLRPESPDDVGAIAWLEWGNANAGKEDSEGQVKTCKIHMIDRATNTLLGVAYFRGPRPAERKGWFGAEEPAAPKEEVLKYLTSFPRMAGKE